VACEIQAKYTRQQFRRQETGERLQPSYGKQQQKLLKSNAPQRTEVTITKC